MTEIRNYRKCADLLKNSWSNPPEIDSGGFVIS